MKFSIASLLLLTTWIALIFGTKLLITSLSYDNQRHPLDAVCFLVTAFSTIAIIGAFTDSKVRRPFWIGYAVASIAAAVLWIFGGAAAYIPDVSRPSIVSTLGQAWSDSSRPNTDYRVAIVSLIRLGYIPIIGAVGGVVGNWFSKRERTIQG